MPELADNAVAALRRNYPQHPSLDERATAAQYVPGEDTARGQRAHLRLVDRATPPVFDNRDLFDNAPTTSGFIRTTASAVS